MPYNDLTIEAASAYAIDPESQYDTFAALLVFSLLFHREIVFVDSHFINNPGLRRVARHRPGIFDCLELASVKIALRKDAESISSLMSAQAERGAFAPYFQGDRDRYLSEDMQLVSALGQKIDSAYRYDIAAQGQKFTSLAMHNLKRCAEELSQDDSARYAAFMATLQDIRARDSNNALTQLDFRWDDEKSRLHAALREQGLMEWCTRHNNLIYDLQVHAYRMTASNVLQVRSIIDRKADEMERRLAPDVVINERRVVIENRYFYARNLCRMTPEILLRIFSSEEAHTFFEVRDSKFGTYSVERQERVTREYIGAIDRIMTEYAGRLSFTPGQGSHITLVTRVSDAFLSLAQSFNSLWSNVERWVDVTLKLELDRAVALALNVEVSAGVVKEALNVGAKSIVPIAHAVRARATSNAVRSLRDDEAELGKFLTANVERVVGNSVQL